MKSSKLPAIIAASVGLYFCFVGMALASFNLGPPRWLEMALSIAAAPGVILLMLWSKPLRALGWAQGELISAPHPLAALAIAALYCALAYLATRAVQTLLSRWR